MLGRSSVSVSRSGNLRPENALPKFCLTVFVIGLVIFFTIYKIQDPLFHPSSKITNFLSSNYNYNYNPTDQSAFAALINLTGIVFEEEPNVASDNTDCGVNDPIKCRDSDVFHLLMRAAIDKFKDVQFYRFGKPVRGENDTSCHMAWRFRAKEGDAAPSKKDYRSFSLVRFDNCTLIVVGIGGYHSGVNARMKRGKTKGKDKELAESGEAALPLIESESSFSSGKYLVYTGGGDRCNSMNQYLWSFTCMLGEALFLNRTLVMDLSMCLSKIYSSSGVDEEGKDFRFYFDFEHLKDSASVIDHAQFWSGWTKWQQKHGLTLHLVEDVRVTPMKLADAKDSLIMRKFGSVEPDNYWSRVCEGETESVIRRPWGMIWKSRRLLDVASAITARMKWDFDALHVERGERVRNKKLWPNLDTDTSPKSLLAKLKNKIEGGRKVYIATNEKETSFFDPLKDKYSTHFLEDYKDLWDANSEWYFETTKLNNGNAVEFDGYMRISVDSEVFMRGKKQIETFNDLTRDCKYKEKLRHNGAIHSSIIGNLLHYCTHGTIMADEAKIDEKYEKQKTIAVPKSPRGLSSIPTSPIGGLRRSSSVKKNNCLCSPTTHAGSFRCRHHRNSGLARSGMSVGSKLSELAAEAPVMCDNMHIVAAHRHSSTSSTFLPA